MSERDLDQPKASTEQSSKPEGSAASERPGLSTSEERGRADSRPGEDPGGRPELGPRGADAPSGGRADEGRPELARPGDPGRIEPIPLYRPGEGSGIEPLPLHHPEDPPQIQLLSQRGEPEASGGMSGPHATSSAGKSGQAELSTADPRSAKPTEAASDTAKPGPAKGAQEKPGPDGRTNSQIRAELENRTGKSYDQIIIGLGRGPIDPAKLSPRAVEKELESNGTLRHREEDKKEPTVIDNVLVPHQYQPDRFVTEGRVGPASKIDAEVQAGRDAVNKAIVTGISGGLAGMKPGSASEGLVKPAPETPRGYEPRPPTTYDATRGAHKPDPPSAVRDLAGPRPGELNEARGFQNERHVAQQIDGTLARDNRAATISAGGSLRDTEIRYTLPNGQQGVARVDVYGPRQELVQVGGPAKADNLGKTISDLTNLQRAAESRGVSAEAYFTADTPKPVLDAASRVLGADHVHTFERPDYRSK